MQAYFLSHLQRWVLVGDNIIIGKYATLTSLLREARDTYGVIPTIVTYGPA